MNNINSISEYKIFERNKTYSELEVLINNCKEYNGTITSIISRFIDECNYLKEIKLSTVVMAQILMENYKYGNNSLLWSEWLDLIDFIIQHKKMKQCFSNLTTQGLGQCTLRTLSSNAGHACVFNFRP